MSQMVTLRMCVKACVVSTIVGAELLCPRPAVSDEVTCQTDYIKRMMSLDQDKDGLLSKAELPGPMAASFDRDDANGDGLLSPKELAAAEAKAFAARHPESSTNAAERGRRNATADGSRNVRTLNTTGPGSPLDSNQILRFALTFDRDKDGGLNAAELRSYATALAARRARGRRQPTDSADPHFTAPEVSLRKNQRQAWEQTGIGDGGFGDAPK